MFRLHQLAVFAAMSGGYYVHAARGREMLGALVLSPEQVALGHAYNGGGQRKGKHQRQPLKSCRNKISRRVRRKHRRAA